MVIRLSLIDHPVDTGRLQAYVIVSRLHLAADVTPLMGFIAEGVVGC